MKAAFAGLITDLPREPGLADPGVTGQEDDAPLPGLRSIQSTDQLPQLGIPADQHRAQH